MIFTVPLQAGTTLSNVVYRWIASGSIGSEESSGVTQPWATVPVFRIDSDPPTDAEEIVVYDSTDSTNWNAGGYRKGLAAVGDADQILLASLYVPTSSPSVIVPSPSQDASVCRCYGTFKDPASKSSEGVSITFTLVQPDTSDPGIVNPLSATTVKADQLITGRSVEATLTGGQLTDSDGNSYQDLIRNDYITPSGTKYLVASEGLGALTGLALTTETGPTTGAPVLVELRRRSFDLSRLGDVLLGELTIT